MKLLTIFIILPILSNTLIANSKFCIQVTAVHNFSPENLKPAVTRILNNFDVARIDKRNGKMVLRVGNYNKYSYALKNLKDIQEMYSDAYIRRCNYIPSEVIYPKNVPQDTQPINSRVLQSQMKQEQNIKIKKRVRKRRLVIVNGKVQIIDETAQKRVQSKRTLKIKKVPLYRELPTIQKQNIALKSKEKFIYNKDNRYSNDFYKDCKRCYATIETESTPKKEKQLRRKRKTIAYPRHQKTIINVDTHKKEDWFKEIFDDEKETLPKEKIHYTYIEEKPLSHPKEKKKDAYYNHKITKQEKILIEPNKDIFSNHTEIQHKAKKPEDEFFDMFTDDTKENEEDNVEVEGYDDIDVDVENIENEIEDYSLEDIEDIEPEKKEPIHKKKDVGFFDFLKKSPSKIKHHSTPKKIEKDDEIEENYDDVDIDVDNIKDYSLDAIEDIEPLEHKKQNNKEKKHGFFDFLKKPVKKEIQKEKVVPIRKTREERNSYDDYTPIDNYKILPTIEEPIKKITPYKKEKEYNLMDEYESDNIKEEKPYKQQAYFNQNVIDEIKEEKTPNEFYKNQYIFENSQNKDSQHNPISKIEEPMKRYVEITKEPIKKYVEITKEPITQKIETIQDDTSSYKHQYMYQHQNTPIQNEENYVDDTVEDENAYKKQYMYQNSGSSGMDEAQPFFIKDDKKDNPEYQYKHSNHPMKESEIDDDY